MGVKYIKNYLLFLGVMMFVMTMFGIEAASAIVDNSFSDDIDSLNQDINDKRNDIEKLNSRIDGYKEKIKQKQSEKVSLAGEMDLLDNRIAKTELEIEEVLEVLIEDNNETRAEVKEEASQSTITDGSDGSVTITENDVKEVLEELKEDSEVEDVKQSIPKEVFTQKLLDELECGVNPHKLMCLEKNETSDNNTATATDDR